MGGAPHMIRSELISKLELISSQLDHLEQMLEEKMAQNKNGLITEMAHHEKRMKQQLKILENTYEIEKKQAYNKNLTLPLAR